LILNAPVQTTTQLVMQFIINCSCLLFAESFDAYGCW